MSFCVSNVPQRLPKVLALAPAERLLRTRDEDLNVDIGVVHLQFGIGPALEVHVHHIDENIRPSSSWTPGSMPVQSVEAMSEKARSSRELSE